MHPIRAIAVACLLIPSLAAPLAAKSPCGTAEEIAAAQLRQFHYELQVAALNCRGDDPSLSGKWAAYVQRHGATLSENATVMRGYFVRTGKGAAAFDRFNTVITNRESIRVHEIPGYCDLHGTLFDQVLADDQKQLVALANAMVGKPADIHACTEATQVANGAAPKKKPAKVAKGD